MSDVMIGYGEGIPSSGLISKLKEYQSGLSILPVEQQCSFAMKTINEDLGDPRTIDGLKSIYIIGLSAFVLADIEPASMDEVVYSGTYIPSGLFLADFDELAYVDTGEIRSICLGLARVEVIKAQENENLEGQTIESGLYVPVQGVQTVRAA